MSRRSLILAPALVVAFAIPAGAGAAPGPGAWHVHAKKADKEEQGAYSHRPAGTGGGRRIR